LRSELRVVKRDHGFGLVIPAALMDAIIIPPIGSTSLARSAAATGPMIPGMLGSTDSASDDTGAPQAVRYHFVDAMLLNEVQRQRATIVRQESKAGRRGSLGWGRLGR
jgi:hypothetical protein